MGPFPDRRNWSIVAVVVTVFMLAGAASGESFPYRARISVPGAPIHSGDGDSFYVTDTLPEGEEVDVYRHKPNGWCAIRPPQESFSWVHGAHLKLLDDSLAEIDKEDVASRIGSRLNRHRNAVQVRLKKGEVVQVLGEVDEGGTKWYKIAPPAGEFRWIHSSRIRRLDEVPGGPSVDADPVLERTLPPIVIESEPPRDAMDSVQATVATGDAPATGTPAANSWRAAPIAPPLADASPISSSPPTTNAAVATSSPFVANTPAVAPSTPAPALTPAPASSPVPVPQTIGVVSDHLNRQLTDVELRLSRMVSEPPVAWQTEPLRREAEQLLAQSQTVAERTAVKSTLDKVDRFAAIQRRYQVVVSSGPRGAAAPGALSLGGTTAPQAGQYDAVGTLRPVVSKRPGAPQFALVDARGQVVSFVTSTPDVNLQPYLGRRVGVVGNRGYIPEFQRAHVTAGRVMPLEQTIVR